MRSIGPRWRRRLWARHPGVQRRATVDMLDRRRGRALDAVDRALSVDGRQVHCPDPNPKSNYPAEWDVLIADAAARRLLPVADLTSAADLDFPADDIGGDASPPDDLVLTLVAAPHGPTITGVTPVAA